VITTWQLSPTKEQIVLIEVLSCSLSVMYANQN